MKGFLKLKLMGIFLALTLCVTSAVPTFAATTANNKVSTYASNSLWESGVHDVGSFYMTNTNLTPRKTMGVGGRLIVYGAFSQNDQIGSLALKVTIYNRTKGTSVTNHFIYNEGHLFALETNVSKGDILQIYFDAYTAPGGSNPSGAYRKAYISYSYSLT